MIMNMQRPDKNTILVGDSLSILKEWPDSFINTCVTSPPYWGLRDYGTANWNGGSEDCDHKANHQKQGATGVRAGRTFTAEHFYKHECLKCGATRIDEQLGLEKTPEEYIGNMVALFREVRRVLRDDGTLWLNLGDSYAANRGYQVPQKLRGGPAAAEAGAAGGRGTRAADYGLKPKDLVGIPWRVAIALQADGWYLRSDIIWHKPNPMPESVTDRPTKAHEYIFLLSKNQDYYYDYESIREDSVQAGRIRNDKIGGNKDDAIHHSPGGQFTGAAKRNKRSVWTVATRPFHGAHFATFPPGLVVPCITAGAPSDGIVLDPFMGSGTVALVSKSLGRNYIGIELNPKNKEMAENRIKDPWTPGAFTKKPRSSDDGQRTLL